MTNKLRCVIVDDEYLARGIIKEYLTNHPDIEIIGECDNGVDAIDFINQHNPDLIFLDIQMPMMNGLEVLLHTNCQQSVIFSTAYDQFAIDAFNNNAVDYLLKSYSQARFDQALIKAKQQVNSQQLISNLLANNLPYLARLMVKDRGKTHIIPVDTIDYIEAEDDYVAIHVGEITLLKTQRLSDLEQQLDPSRFMRIHRSIIVRIAAINSFERSTKDTHTIKLHSNISLPVSRTGYERLKQIFTQ